VWSLEEIEDRVQEHFPEWVSLIDEEPTIWKEFLDKNGKPVLVFIDEDGCSVSYSRDNDNHFLSQEDYNKTLFGKIVGVHLIEFDANKQEVTYDVYKNVFSDETLNEIRTYMKKFIECLK
jgi:hypothetical protein